MPKNRKIILVVLVTLELLTMHLMYKSSHNKKIALDQVELKEQIDHNSFAVFFDGQEYDGNTFPNNTILDMTQTTCINEFGDKIENLDITYTNGLLTIKNKETTYCTLYFRTKNTLEILRESDTTNQLTTNLVGGMYRYQGTDNVNNWICFGTSDKNQCITEEGIDKYMYRIIGITPEGELKLIKETFIKEDNVLSFYWNNKLYDICGSNNENCMWPDSFIYKRLNGISNGITKGEKGDTNIFIGNSYYDYLSNNTWLLKIAYHNWKYGTLDSSYNGDEMYSIENAFSSFTSARIGLLYMHDYLYAYKTNEGDAGNPGYNNAKNAWIHFLKDGYNDVYCELYPDHCSHPDYPHFFYENTMVGYKYNGSPWYYFTISYIGDVRNVASEPQFYGNRPVFYLTSEVKISNAIGNKTDPFIITN